MEKIKFEIYDKIEIYSNAGELIGRSEVQEHKEDVLHISAPIGLDGIKILEVGEKISAIYYHDTKTYKFTTKVINRFVEGMKIFVLQKPEKYEVIQRRESVRVDHSLPITYVVLSEKETELLLNSNVAPKEIKTEFAIRFIEAKTFNVSAAGLGIFTMEDTIKTGDHIIGFIDIDGREEMIFMQAVKITRDHTVPNSAVRKIGTKFVKGSRGLEERMFQDLFTVMRNQKN